MTEEEIRAIVMREYSYWRDCPADSAVGNMIALGAMGALANVIAALHGMPSFRAKEGTESVWTGIQDAHQEMQEMGASSDEDGETGSGNDRRPSGRD